MIGIYKITSPTNKIYVGQSSNIENRFYLEKNNIITDYAKYNNISYNGAKKFRDVKKIFNINFIIDNN